MSYRFASDNSIPYAADRVKTIDCSSGTKYFLEDANDSTNWRWLTPEEKTQFAGSDDDHDHARADDDGFGAAIGAAAPISDYTDAAYDDLGKDWGQSSPVPEDADVAAIRAAAVAGPDEPGFNKTPGQQTSLAGERALADAAIELINSSVGNTDKVRYTVIAYHVKDVNPTTTAADIDHYSIVATADNFSLARVAENEMLKDAFKRGDFGIPANELEI